MYVLSQLDSTFGILILMLQRATEILSRVKNEVSNKVIVDQLLKMIVRLLSGYFEGELRSHKESYLIHITLQSKLRRSFNSARISYTVSKNMI